MMIVISDDVRACTANGVDYPLGQPFSFMDGCFIFNCDCHSDGSWECPEDRAVDRCRRTPDGGQRPRGREPPIDIENTWASVNRPSERLFFFFFLSYTYLKLLANDKF